MLHEPKSFIGTEEKSHVLRLVEFFQHRPGQDEIAHQVLVGLSVTFGIRRIAPAQLEIRQTEKLRQRAFQFPDILLPVQEQIHGAVAKPHIAILMIEVVRVDVQSAVKLVIEPARHDIAIMQESAFQVGDYPFDVRRAPGRLQGFQELERP